jgi:hypothetical protein
METILCAAIWYEDLESKYSNLKLKYPNKGIIITGLRHINCISTLNYLTGKRSVKPEVGNYIQGFITNTGRFVDRHQAMEIAVEQNQVQIENLINPKIGLFSEDLY